MTRVPRVTVQPTGDGTFRVGIDEFPTATVFRTEGEAREFADWVSGRLAVLAISERP